MSDAVESDRSFVLTLVANVTIFVNGTDLNNTDSSGQYASGTFEARSTTFWSVKPTDSVSGLPVTEISIIQNASNSPWPSTKPGASGGPSGCVYGPADPTPGSTGTTSAFNNTCSDGNVTTDAWQWPTLGSSTSPGPRQTTLTTTPGNFPPSGSSVVNPFVSSAPRLTANLNLYVWTLAIAAVACRWLHRNTAD